MKAEDFINESSISQINTPETGGEWAIKVDDVVKLMEQYAQHSAQERYDEAIKYKNSVQFWSLTKALKIASGLDTPNNDEG